ncbi:hypothetical protein DV735_g1816, partial [Chaetothyriales sp. CBS 134920]
MADTTLAAGVKRSCDGTLVHPDLTPDSSVATNTPTKRPVDPPNTSPAAGSSASTLESNPPPHNASVSPAKKRKLTFMEKEVEKAERLAAKEEKARLKAEEKDRKEEEKRLRDEEKRRKAEEKDAERAKREVQRAEKDAEKAEKKRVKEVEKARKLAESTKKDKSQMRIGAFFVQPAPTPTTQLSTPDDDCSKVLSRRSSVGSNDPAPPLPDNKPLRSQSAFSKWILPFFPHDHTSIAPHNRFITSGAMAPVCLDLPTQHPDITSQTLSDRFAGRRKRNKHIVPVKTLVTLIEGDDQKSDDYTSDEASIMLSKTPYKILQFHEDPVLRALPDTDYDYDSEADKLPTSYVEPVSTGLCWEGETNLDGLSIDIAAYRLDVLNYGAEFPINPFSDDLWGVAKDTLVKGTSTSTTQRTTMQPPRMPLATVNLPNGTVSRGMGSSHTGTSEKDASELQMQKSKLKKLDKPIKMVSENLLPAFKEAVAGNDLNKVALVEILKKKFPTCSKDSIKATLEAVAVRQGKKEADKRWVLLPPLAQLRQFTGSAGMLTEGIPVRIHGRGTGVAQIIDVEGTPFKIQTDAYRVLGGNGASPSPISFSLVSLGSCAQVTGSVVARDHNIKLGEWHVAVDGLLPTAVFVQGKEGSPNWDNVELKVRVQTDIEGGSDDAKFKHFVSEVERRCPMVQLFKRSGLKFESEWVNLPV